MRHVEHLLMRGFVQAETAADGRFGRCRARASIGDARSMRTPAQP
jgi:hypothetical protein